MDSISIHGMTSLEVYPSQKREMQGEQAEFFVTDIVIKSVQPDYEHDEEGRMVTTYTRLHLFSPKPVDVIIKKEKE